MTTAMRIRQIKELKVEGLGDRIRQARLAIADQKSLEKICAEAGISKTYWYDMEKEKIKGALSIENLRKIEKILNANFGVDFND